MEGMFFATIASRKRSMSMTRWRSADEAREADGRAPMASATERQQQITKEIQKKRKKHGPPRRKFGRKFRSPAEISAGCKLRSLFSNLAHDLLIQTYSLEHLECHHHPMSYRASDS